MFSHTLRRLGIECIYIDKNATDEEIDAAFQSNTKAVFGETYGKKAYIVKARMQLMRDFGVYPAAHYRVPELFYIEETE